MVAYLYFLFMIYLMFFIKSNIKTLAPGPQSPHLSGTPDMKLCLLSLLAGLALTEAGTSNAVEWLLDDLFEDGAITAISSCASSASKLTAKAANLAANNASMTAAKEKMNSLASSRSSGVAVRDAASSCSEVITISQTSKLTGRGGMLGMRL